MSNSDFPEDYQSLFEAAADVLRKNRHPVKHSVGAAVLCASGNIYTGINLESSGYGVCAEPIALGAALSSGEKEILAVIAVADRPDGFIVLSPCGNCRQMMLDYASQATVIYMDTSGVTQAKVKNLLPGAYISPDFADI